MNNSATLPLLLKQLGLPSMLAHYSEQAIIAEKAHWEYTQYLAVLSQMEAANRRQKRVARHVKESKLH